MTIHPPPRLAHLLRGLAALIALVAIEVGVPLLLVGLHLAPHAVPSWRQINEILRSRDDGQLVAVA